MPRTPTPEATPAATPALEPDVRIVDTRPPPKNPWPRTILLLGVLASVTTCSIAAQFAPGAKPLRAPSPVAQATKPHTRHHRKPQRIHAPVTQATSPVAQAHNSAGPHEDVNKQP